MYSIISVKKIKCRTTKHRSENRLFRTITIENTQAARSNIKIYKTAKPFLKWVGGKGQLLKEIEKYYPFANGKITKYAEPFVGGGAVLFDILNKYKLEKVYISDINAELINTYCIIKDDVNALIDILSAMQNIFISKDTENRKDYYLSQRERFNELKVNNNEQENIEKAALMIFLKDMF